MPWALLETICAVAMPVALISRSMRKTGIPASTAFCTGAIDASAPALSRTMATAPCVIAASISSLCLFGSSSCDDTLVS